MENVVCWEQNSVKEIIDPLALNIEAALLLATHTPFENLNILLDRQQEVPSHTEESLLESVLAYGETKNAFVIIEGAPGTGKSNLIWWFSHKLNQRMGNAKVILIKRAEASLARTLKSLVEHLGDGFEDLVGDFSKAANNLSKTGLKHKLLDNLSLMLRPEAVRGVEGIPQDIVRLSPWAFLGSDYVRKTLGGSDGVITRIIDRITSDKHNYEGIVQFQPDDLKLPTGPGINRMDSAAKHLAVRLIRDPGLRKQMSDTLNEQLNKAISGILDLTGDRIFSIFDEIRKRLGKDQTLVMLIEDIATFQGVDRDLINYFSDPQVREDMCNLISVIGITDDYCSTLKDNIMDRRTHHARLEEGQGKGLFPDLGSLANFSGRYLNAVRIGGDKLKQWNSESTSSDSTPPPNACTDCEHHDKCHTTFGASAEGHGLYPFTSTALWHCLKSSELEHKNARTLLIDILQPILRDSYDHIQRNKFPNDPIAQKIERPSPHVAGGIVQTYLEEKIPNDNIGELPRYKTLLAYYGDGTVQEGSNEAGELTVGGIPFSLFGAFGLPLDESLSPSPPTLPPDTPPAPPDSPPDTPPDTPPPPTEPDEYKEKAKNLEQWADAQSKLDYIQWYRPRIWSALKEFIDWDSSGISEHERDRLAKDTTIRLEEQLGEHLAEENTICIKRNDTARDALDALLRFNLIGEGTWKFDNSLESQRSLARFLHDTGDSLLHFLKSAYGKSESSRSALLEMAAETLVWAAQVLGIFRAGDESHVALERISAFEHQPDTGLDHLGDDYEDLYAALSRQFAGIRDDVFKTLDKRRSGGSHIKFLGSSVLLEALRSHGSRSIKERNNNYVKLRCNALWNQMFEVNESLNSLPGILDGCITRLRNGAKRITMLLGGEKPEEYSDNIAKAFSLASELNMAGRICDDYRDLRINRLESETTKEINAAAESLGQLKTDAQKLDFCLNEYPRELDSALEFLEAADSMKAALIAKIMEEGDPDIPKKIAEKTEMILAQNKDIRKSIAACLGGLR